jgi:enamine deaminase RidA (YjgF/YER057c/UK114 family)
MLKNPQAAGPMRRPTRSLLIALLVFASLGALALQAASKQTVGHVPGQPQSPAVRAGDFIYVSGALATDERGAVSGDIKAQTRRALDHLAATLGAAGSRLENVAKVFVYLRSRDDFRAMNEVYRTYWPKDPPARTTIEADLLGPGALIAIAATAIPDGGERRVIHPAEWIPSPNPYSYGIKSGDTLFLAGLVARHGCDNSVVTGDVGVQTRAVLDNAGEILKAAGMSYGDVVSARVFLTDAAAFREMNEAYRPYFPADPPARATVVTRLNDPKYLVEITLLAVKDASRRAITTPAASGAPGRPNPNFSSAIRAGNRLYLAGMLGLTDPLRSDAGEQAREALARIGRTLRAAGFDWSHVVDGTVYLGGPSHRVAVEDAYRTVFTGDLPARTMVGTGLIVPEGLVEIMLTAVK